MADEKKKPEETDEENAEPKKAAQSEDKPPKKAADSEEMPKGETIYPTNKKSRLRANLRAMQALKTNPKTYRRDRPKKISSERKIYA